MLCFIPLLCSTTTFPRGPDPQRRRRKVLCFPTLLRFKRNTRAPTSSPVRRVRAIQSKSLGSHLLRLLLLPHHLPPSPPPPSPSPPPPPPSPPSSASALTKVSAAASAVFLAFLAFWRTRNTNRAAAAGKKKSEKEEKHFADEAAVSV